MTQKYALIAAGLMAVAATVDVQPRQPVTLETRVVMTESQPYEFEGKMYIDNCYGYGKASVCVGKPYDPKDYPQHPKKLLK